MRHPKDLAEEQARLISVCLVIIAAVATGAALAYMRPALVPFVLAVFLYYIVSPLADLLELRAHLPRWASTIVTLLVVAGLIFAIGLLATFSMRGLLASADLYRERLTELTQQVVRALNAWGIDIGQPVLLEWVRALPTGRMLQTSAGRAFGLLTNGFLILIFVIFLLLGRRREMIKSAVFREIDSKIRRFLGLKFVISAVTGILVGLILSLLGLDLALVFGLLTFFLNFIPSVGSIVAVLLPMPVAIVQYDTLLPVMGVLVLPGIVQMVIGNGIDPKIMGQGLDLSPVTVLIALVFWGLIWGVAGMLLAAPMTAILRIVLAQFDTTWPASELLAGRFPEAGHTGTWTATPPPGIDQSTAAPTVD
ncbi:MAG: AI-2E family transporter [Gemmatimonadales bacterium]